MFDTRAGSTVHSGGGSEGAVGPRALPAHSSSRPDAPSQSGIPSHTAIPSHTGIDALAMLEGLDVTGLPAGQLMEVLQAWDRQAAWVAANSLRVMAAVSEQLLRKFAADPVARSQDYPMMIAEIATATRQSEFRVGQRCATAHQLTRVLPDTLSALHSGQIGDYQAQLIGEETFLLDPDDARDVETRVLAKASRQNPSQLRRSLRTAIHKVDPDAAGRRAARAVKDRNVWTRPLPDGMAELGATGPAAAIHAMFGALDARAENPRPADDTRLIGARRFDALLHALTGAGVPAGAVSPTADSGSTNAADPASADGPDRPASPASAEGPASPANAGGPYRPASPANADGSAGPSNPAGRSTGIEAPDSAIAAPNAGIAAPDSGSPGDCASDYVPMGPGFLGDGGPPLAAIVHLTMDLPTLLGLQDNPAQLAGYGSLPAALARDLAASNPWRRLITDPLTGHLLDAGRTSYRPPAALADYIRARDKTCRFPGCSRSAWKADLDHRIRWRDNGPSDRDNLAALCKKHHRLKHRGWTYRFIVNGRDTATGDVIDTTGTNDTTDTTGVDDPCDNHQILWTSPTGHTYRTYPDSDTHDDPLRPPPDIHPDDQQDWA